LHLQVNVGDPDTRNRSTAIDPIPLLPGVEYKSDDLREVEQKRAKTRGVNLPASGPSDLPEKASPPIAGAVLFNRGLTVANENGAIDPDTEAGPYEYTRTKTVGKGRNKRTVKQ